MYKEVLSTCHKSMTVKCILFRDLKFEEFIFLVLSCDVDDEMFPLLFLFKQPCKLSLNVSGSCYHFFIYEFRKLLILRQGKIGEKNKFYEI